MQQRQLVIGIETSGWSGSIALVEGAQVVSQRILDPTGRRHARTLAPEIQSLLAEAGRTAKDLEVVAVSSGPGSFTGLRVGVVCAKTLAWAAQSAIVAIDTYQAIATQCPEGVNIVDVVGDGQRGDLYVGRYRRTEGGGWRREGDIAIRPAEEWLAELTPTAAVTGPGLERWQTEASGRCRVLPRDGWKPQASTIALLGHERAIAGKTDDPWTLAPFYLRRSAAEEQADAGVR